MYDFFERMVVAIHEMMACIRVASLPVLALFTLDLALVIIVAIQLTNVLLA